MSRIDGVSRAVIAEHAERLVDMTLSAVWHTLNEVTRTFGSTVSLESIGDISTVWRRYVPALRDSVGQSFIDAAALTRVAQHDAVVAVVRDRESASLTAAADQEFEIPLVRNVAAEQHMLNAENLLSNVGNDVWERARSELLVGMHNGEDVQTMRNRVMSAADFSAARAEVIARTEVARAMNAGSLAQMKMLDVPGITKEWIATHDGRTRASHLALDGHKVSINSPFPGGLEPGAEPNCRCTHGFDVPDDDLAGVCG